MEKQWSYLQPWWAARLTDIKVYNLLHHFSISTEKKKIKSCHESWTSPGHSAPAGGAGVCWPIYHLSFLRREVWGGRSEIFHSHPSHILSCCQGSTQGLISLDHPAMEPLVTVLNGRKHLHPSCANSRALELLSHPILSHPFQSPCPHTHLPLSALHSVPDLWDSC